MFLSLLLPGFLVVVAGYVVGHTLWSWISGLVDPSTGTTPAPGAEVVGWLTGAVALLAVLWLAWLRRRRRARRRGPR